MNGQGLQKNVEQFHALLQQVTTLLPENFDAAQRQQVATLVELLRKNAVPGALCELTAAQLGTQLLAIYQLLRQRQDEVAVRVEPLPGLDQRLILCSCVDAPFLFDSLLLYLRRQKLCWQVVTHLRLRVQRQQGRLQRLTEAAENLANEALLVVQVEEVLTSDEMVAQIGEVLHAVLRVATDRGGLQQRLEQMQPLAQQAGQADFWHWLLEDNFAALAYRQLDLAADGTSLAPVPDSALGLALQDCASSNEPSALLWHCDAQTRVCLQHPRPVAVMQTACLSPIWRDELLNLLLVQETRADGSSTIHQFAGLFTHHSQQGSALDLPALQHKILAALKELNVSPDSYNYRRALELLAAFPKTELFFVPLERLRDTITTLLFYQHSRVRVLSLESDRTSRNLLLVIPAALSSGTDFSELTSLLQQQCVADSVSCRLLHVSSEDSIVLAHVAAAGGLQVPPLDSLADQLTSALLSWEQRLRQALTETLGVRRGMILWRQYQNAFCRDYRARVEPLFSVRDILRLEALHDGQGEQVELWGPLAGSDPQVRCLQLYTAEPGYLNDLMPGLVNLDLTVVDEIDFTVNVYGRRYFIKSFGVLDQAPQGGDLTACGDNLLAALRAIRSGKAENDYLNRLLLRTGLDWQQIDVFRAYRNYYFQLGSPFTKKTVAFALINHPRAALALFRYFEARFRPLPEWNDPLEREEQVLTPARMALIEALAAVENVNEDRILRTLFNCIDSTVRTNFFRRLDAAEFFISFKISAIGITEMPVPRPLFEVYVHSATMEGIHLRGGLVARGGIRWSDRPDDFRTEVLGLMKTQMTKNAVIVPVGSKGGFIVKTPFSDRETGLALSKAAYQTLMRGLLDLTDNRLTGELVPPAEVVRYDGDDPYLVVAADKGTAHLPDTANAISAEYRFWLADGFASGGSQGYDHKALGITARGAWVCVQRHFRELGIDVQNEPISVVGIGDMSGDVFGNGMLQSHQIRLLAAFNHRHIFLDPDPDPMVSFSERQRLFRLPRSGWNDYDPQRISAGGGVFERSAKDIPLSPQVRQWLGVRHESLDGDSLVHLLLQAPIDLLWNGGIGTYVKSSQESAADVGDRANDAVRIDGCQLRARVVGEGGNLGFTQRGRIEYAVAGGRINTDAIDNSAGVDCSDHEVNLKIFMQQLLEQGLIADVQERNALLQSMTDEVCLAVLANNYRQSLCLSLDRLRCQREPAVFVDLASRLQDIGLLDPVSEALPSAREVLARADGYCRPELAILLAYSKMQLYQALLEEEPFDEEQSRFFLRQYFPAEIDHRFGPQLSGHPLRHPIAATLMTNQVVDQGGASLCFRLARRHQVTVAQVARTYVFFDVAIDGASLRDALFAGDNRLPAAEQYRWLLQLEDALTGLCDWALRLGWELNHDSFQTFRAALQPYRATLSSVVDQSSWSQLMEQVQHLQELGLAENAAQLLATCRHLVNLPPLLQLMRNTDSDLHSLAVTLNDVSRAFALDLVRQQLGQVPLRDRWDQRASSLLKSRVAQLLYQLVEQVMRNHAGNLDRLLSAQRSALQRYRSYLGQLQENPPATFHPFVVLFEQLERLLQADRT